MGLTKSRNHGVRRPIVDNNEIIRQYFDILQEKQCFIAEKNSTLLINKQVCMIKKNFDETGENNNYHNVRSRKEIDWKNYLIKYLKKKSEKNSNWAKILFAFIEKEAFLFESSFLSFFFYYEFELETKPKCLTTNKKNLVKKKKMDMNDIARNLGGSIVSINPDGLLPDDPRIEYELKRDMIKSYIQVFKEHLFDQDHPINQVIVKFAQVISTEIKQERTKVPLDNNLLEHYIKEVQTFILKIQIAAKIFYSNTVNYEPLAEEKDEFINLVCWLVFEVSHGVLYDEVYELYQIGLRKKVKEFEVKLNNMSDITLKDLGIKKEFRLDNSTREYINTLIKENKLKQKPPKTIKNTKLEQLKNHTNKNTSINNVNEREQDFYINRDESLRIESQMDNTFRSDDADENNFKTRVGSLLQENKISFNVIDNQKSSILIRAKNHPIICSNPFYSYPYESVIDLARTLPLYGVPFHQMLIIANLSIEITKSIHDFWEEMNVIVSNDLLALSADELMSIFVYIIIKANVPEILIYQQMINDFTTACTKSSMLGYYCTTIECVISFLHSTDDLKKLQDKVYRSSMLPDRSTYRNDF